jgi:hypothetical protein
MFLYTKAIRWPRLKEGSLDRFENLDIALLINYIDHDWLGQDRSVKSST